MEYIATFADGHKASTLAHYGIRGQKHGVRRFQYKDGSLTPEGTISNILSSMGVVRHSFLVGKIW